MVSPQAQLQWQVHYSFSIEDEEKKQDGYPPSFLPQPFCPPMQENNSWK